MPDTRPDEGGKERRSSLTTLEKSAGILIAIVTAWSAYQGNTLDRNLQVQTQEFDRFKTAALEARETRKLDQEITLKVFEEIKDVLRSDRKDGQAYLSRLESVAALVETIPDERLRNSLASLITTAARNASGQSVAGSPLAEKAAQVGMAVDRAVFNAQQNEPASGAGPAAWTSADGKPPRWANYDFDIFWCEKADSPDQAKQLAERIALARNLDPSAAGRWRVRKLLAEVNERQGYQISGYTMRVNSEEERRLAGELAAIVQKQGGTAFTVTRTNFPTPWYISVFVCPGARKP